LGACGDVRVETAGGVLEGEEVVELVVFVLDGIHVCNDKVR
jgi:hypothetical protein